MDRKSGRRIIICISRQYGSGGHIVGERLARQLGVPFYDKNLLSKTAIEHGVSEATIETVDEQPVNWLTMGFPMGMRNPYAPQAASFEDGIFEILNDQVFNMQSETIKRIANEGSCVIVGRAADEVLRSDPDMIAIFIHADLEDRVQRIMALEKVDHARAEQLVRRMDKKRASYHNYYADRKWGEAASYHLTISTTRFGLDGTVAAIRRLIDAT